MANLSVFIGSLIGSAVLTELIRTVALHIGSY